MKLLVLSVFVLISVISCKAAPQVSSEFATEDDIAKRRINETLEAINKLSNNNEMSKSVLKSIDQQCMLETYQSNKLMHELTEEALNLEEISEITNVDPYVAFASIALSCCNKLDGVVGFIFDLLYSFSGLIDTFRDDEPFKEFVDDLICYNNYAVKTNVLDPNEFTLLKYQLVNKTQKEECDKEIKKLREVVADNLEFGSSFVVTDHSKCLQSKLASGAEKFFLRYLLLIPLGLTEDQRKSLKLNFVADSREGLQNILLCNIEKKMEADNEISME